MNSLETTLDERIRTFADAVRAHLDDLPADEVDDIIVGLTSDLAEQAADGGGVLELGDPSAYAAELRSAAGLPERSDAVTRERLRARVSRRLGHIAAGMRRSAFGAWLLDLFIALRPVWWLLRGFAIYAVAHAMFGAPSFGGSGSVLPDTLLGWLILLAMMLVSVQWGRGRWLPQNALRHMRTVISVIAVIALPFALASVLIPRVEYIDDGVYQQPGLMLDGVQVGNIFAYDENGELINRVQLYTDRGTPLNLFGGTIEEGVDGTWQGFGWDGDAPVRVPFRDAREAEVWNIYPLKEGRVDPNTGKIRTSTVRDAAAPFLRAPGLLTPSPTPSPVPTPTPTPEP
ncbi:HAAS signaling domain-containing protein [Microbacterium sp. AGC85]